MLNYQRVNPFHGQNHGQNHLYTLFGSKFLFFSFRGTYRQHMTALDVASSIIYADYTMNSWRDYWPNWGVNQVGKLGVFQIGFAT